MKLSVLVVCAIGALSSLAIAPSPPQDALKREMAQMPALNAVEATDPQYYELIVKFREKDSALPWSDATMPLRMVQERSVDAVEESLVLPSATKQNFGKFTRYEKGARSRAKNALCPAQK